MKPTSTEPLSPAAAERLASAYVDHADALRSFALSQGVDLDSANDAVAGAFTAVAALGSPRILQIENMRAYLFTTVLNRVKRQRREYQVTVPVEGKVLDRFPSDRRHHLAFDEMVALAREALESLDDISQRVIVAVLIERRKVREVAKELGLSATNVSTIAHRARQQLQVGYIRGFIELGQVTCGMSSHLLARVVAGAAGKRELRQYRRHLAGCSTCPELERQIGEELRAGSLTYGLIVVILSGAFEAGRVHPAYALAQRRTPLGIIALGALILLLLWPNAVVESADVEGPSPPDSYSAPVAVPVESAFAEISADPTVIAVTMPVPGEEIMWTSTLTNDSDRELTLYAATHGATSDADEAPTVELMRNGESLTAALPISTLPAATSLGRLMPGEAVEVSGIVRRDIDDRIQSLAGSVSVRFVASSSSPGDPPAGAAVPEPTIVPMLPPTGATLRNMAAGALAAAGFVTLGLVLVQRRHRQ